MSKQIYIDSNGNEVQVSGTVNSADMLPIEAGSSKMTSEAIGSLSTLTTSDKSSLVGAVNEIASYTPVYGNTASGSIATFDTSLALPLQDCTIAINAVQESGTPTPTSPKLISGFTGANITNHGINFWDEQWEVGAYDLSTGQKTTANNRIRTKNYIAVLPSTTYFNCCPDIIIALFYDRNKTFLSQYGFNANSSFVTPSNAYYMNFHVATAYGTTYNDNISINNPATDTTYHAYNGNTTAISWQDEAGIVFGGYFRIVNGIVKLVATHGIITFDGSDDEIWNDGTIRYSIEISDCKRTAGRLEVLCNRGLFASSGGSEGTVFVTNTYFYYYPHTSITSLADFKTWLGSNNLVVVYPLATPLTYQLTPTQISAIVGTNNVFTDTNGNTSVVYYTKSGESIAKIASDISVNNAINHTYSELDTSSKTIIGGINENKASIGTLESLDTSVKTNLVNAINEIASYTPVYGNTASGSIATFDTSLALPLQDCTIEINAIQEGSGTPSPQNVRNLVGFTGANVVNCSDNLVTGMTTSTADGITTSYDNTTGLISIENNSRTTNYAAGSSRNAVASNLDTSHTYKYKFIPEITGVIATDAAGVGLPLNEEFTGVASVKLRVTSAYDFVSTHPIGDITTTRLVIVDVTEGGKITTYPVSWNDEAGTVYGGSLDVTSGKLTDNYSNLLDLGSLSWGYNSNYGGIFYANTTANTTKGQAIVCDCYQTTTISVEAPNTDWTAVPDLTIGLHTQGSSKYIYVKNSNYNDSAAFTTAMTGRKYITAIVNATTYQLTPTQISAIVSGGAKTTNNVFTDTNGDTSVVYACSLKDYIDSQ